MYRCDEAPPDCTCRTVVFERDALAAGDAPRSPEEVDVVVEALGVPAPLDL
jgi:hypothetical protein